MVLEPFTTRVRTNIDGVLQMTQMINGIMMTGDSRANQIIVELYNNSGRITIASGTKIVGYFIRGDGYTVEVDGTVTNNGEALVVVPRSAYLSTGAISIAIRLFDDMHTEIIDGTEIITYGTKIVIAALSCFVQNTETDAIVDPDHHIPDVQDVIAKLADIDEKEQAIQAAEALRVTAESGRVAAESGRVATEATRVSAESGRVSAESQRVSNESNRVSAESGRSDAEAQRVANEAIRVSNEQSRVSAEESRALNETARQNAIQNMSVEATALEPYSSPTVTITDVNGHKHISFGMVPGNPFIIKKTFSSIQEMESYTGTDVNLYEFVVITSTTADPDNAKLYMKVTAGWFFVTDLSGAQGIQGPQGIQGETGVSVIGAELNPNYTLTINFSNGTSYTTPTSIRGEQGPQGIQGNTGSQGIQGETGNGIASVVRNQDYTLTITMTDGTSYTTDVPVRGETGATGATGPGISSVQVNNDYTMTINLENGTSYTTPFSMRGPQGEPGTGGTYLNYDSVTDELTITFT